MYNGSNIEVYVFFQKLIFRLSTTSNNCNEHYCCNTGLLKQTV